MSEQKCPECNQNMWWPENEELEQCDDCLVAPYENFRDAVTALREEMELYESVAKQLHGELGLCRMHSGNDQPMPLEQTVKVHRISHAAALSEEESEHGSDM